MDGFAAAPLVCLRRQPQPVALRESLDVFVNHTQQNVSGKVQLKLYKGNVSVIGRESPSSLYSQSVVTFEEDQGAYDQFDAQGFIKLNALRLRLGALAGRRGGTL